MNNPQGRLSPIKIDFDQAGIDAADLKFTDNRTGSTNGELYLTRNEIKNHPTLSYLYDKDQYRTKITYEVFEKADVDGALAAGVFHSGDIQISDLKRDLRERGIAVRP